MFHQARLFAVKVELEASIRINADEAEVLDHILSYQYGLALLLF